MNLRFEKIPLRSITSSPFERRTHLLCAFRARLGHRMQRKVAVSVGLGSTRHTNQAVTFITTGKGMGYFGLGRQKGTELHINAFYAKQLNENYNHFVKAEAI
jgi:hypothetical protein